MDAKTKAIVSHITLIGWIIALVINNSEKEELASFYIRQQLGLLIAWFILWFVPVIGWILNIALFVFWVMSLVGAIQGEQKETPWIGKFFQDWFKAL